MISFDTYTAHIHITHSKCAGIVYAVICTQVVGFVCTVLQCLSHHLTAVYCV